MLSPGDHLKLLVEMMQPLGPQQARRWLAALLLVDRDEREPLIELIERHVAGLYANRPLKLEGLGPQPRVAKPD